MCFKGKKVPPKKRALICPEKGILYNRDVLEFLGKMPYLFSKFATEPIGATVTWLAGQGLRQGCVLTFIADESYKPGPRIEF